MTSVTLKGQRFSRNDQQSDLAIQRMT